MDDNYNLANFLWNEGVSEQYGTEDKYLDHILEQYKLYVEMADRISARRGTANTFFLTVNTVVVGVMALCSDTIRQLAAIIVCIAAIVLCYVWQRLIKSYRQLNTAKYTVVGEIEKKLPCSPYWSAEWKALGGGKDPSKYTQLTVVERVVPFIFMCLYILLAIIIMCEC